MWKSEMTPFNALEYLKNRITRLSLNHKISNRDIAELEVKEIVMGIETHVIPTLEKALERAKKVDELLRLYRKHINNLCKKQREGVKHSLFSSEFVAYELYEKIKQLEKELEEMK